MAVAGLLLWNRAQKSFTPAVNLPESFVSVITKLPVRFDAIVFSEISIVDDC
jgi:hypothetical protein